MCICQVSHVIDIFYTIRIIFVSTHCLFIKCFLINIEKYNLKDSSIAEKLVTNNKKEDEEDENPFKHVQGAMIKSIFRQMYRFVRLVDFIVMDLVRRLVANAIQKLQMYITASFNGVFESQGDSSGAWNDTKQIECPPLFKISLLLCQGKFNIVFLVWLDC